MRATTYPSTLIPRGDYDAVTAYGAFSQSVHKLAAEMVRVISRGPREQTEAGLGLRVGYVTLVERATTISRWWSDAMDTAERSGVDPSIVNAVRPAGQAALDAVLGDEEFMQMWNSARETVDSIERERVEEVNHLLGFSDKDQVDDDDALSDSEAYFQRSQFSGLPTYRPHLMEVEYPDDAVDEVIEYNDTTDGKIAEQWERVNSLDVVQRVAAAAAAPMVAAAAMVPMTVTVFMAWGEVIDTARWLTGQWGEGHLGPALHWCLHEADRERERFEVPVIYRDPQETPMALIHPNDQAAESAARVERSWSGWAFGTATRIKETSQRPVWTVGADGNREEGPRWVFGPLSVIDLPVLAPA